MRRSSVGATGAGVGGTFFSVHAMASTSHATYRAIQYAPMSGGVAGHLPSNVPCTSAIAIPADFAGDPEASETSVGGETSFGSWLYWDVGSPVKGMSLKSF